MLPRPRFAPHYNPPELSARSGNDPPGQNLGAAMIEGRPGGDRVVDRGRGGRWGRRADAVRRTPQAGPGAGAICLPRNMHHLKVASPADMTIAADSRAVTTIAVRKRRQSGPFCDQCHREEIILPVNRWQKVSRQACSCAHTCPLVEHETREEQTTVEKLLLAQPGICPQPLERQQRSSPVLRRIARWLLADAGAEVEGAPAGDSTARGRSFRRRQRSRRIVTRGGWKRCGSCPQ